MKGIRSKRKLYELQVGCGSLGHKSDDGVVFGSKRVTFEDDMNNAFAGEIVNASTNIRDDDVNFKHIIEYTLSCTLERNDKDVSSCV